MRSWATRRVLQVRGSVALQVETVKTSAQRLTFVDSDDRRMGSREKGRALTFERALWCVFLEQVPQELVVDLVVVLHLGRLDEGSQRAWAAVRGGLFQIGIPSFHVFAQ
jgi:hypothetical protein